MTLEEFFKLLMSGFTITDYIVELSYSYDGDKWETSNEYLYYESDIDDFVWFNDWWEGQPYVLVRGYIEVKNVSHFKPTISKVNLPNVNNKFMERRYHTDKDITE